MIVEKLGEARGSAKGGDFVTTQFSQMNGIG